MPGTSGAPTLLGDVPGLDLVAQRVDGLGGGPIQVSPASMHRLGEVGVLGEEPVAGVDGVGAGLRGDLEQLLRPGSSPGVWPPSAKASSATLTCSASRSGSA